ncbi:RNA polymerase sigma factor [bacterium]|nr:RNA polymerase sigma factor [bacterium]
MRPAKAVTTQDGQLIGSFKRGQAEAFDRLMEAHTDKVFALAWSVLMNADDAMDAVQEVFIKLYKALPSMSESDNLNAWLYRVCLNHCIDRKRRAKNSRTEFTDDDWEHLQGNLADEPEYRMYQSEVGRVIRAAVDKLPERQRMVFILRHYRLLSINEIAQALGCTTGAVKAHLSRATARLRDRLAGTIVFEAGEVK